MNITKATDTYRIEDTLQNKFVRGYLTVDTQGHKSVILNLQEIAGDTPDVLVRGNYYEADTDNTNAGIYVNGDADFLLAFNVYFANNLSTILATTIEQ